MSLEKKMYNQPYLESLSSWVNYFQLSKICNTRVTTLTNNAYESDLSGNNLFIHKMWLVVVKAINFTLTKRKSQQHTA